MTFYVSLFRDGEETGVVRYGGGEDSREGTVRHATYTIGGQQPG